MTNSFKIEFTFGLPTHDLRRKLVTITGAATNLFNGYTSTYHSGGWRSPEGKLIEEPSATLMVVTPSENWSVKDGWVRELHDLIKEEMKQEEVMVVKTNVEQINY